MKKDQKGLTLIELMIVIVIIGILAAIAIGITFSLTEKANTKALESDLSMAYKAALTFHAEYPDRQVAKEDLHDYGYRQSKGVNIEIVDGTLENLLITATHPGVLGVYQVDETGQISKQ